MGRDGRPIRNMIDPPQPQENGWYRCPWRPFHFEHLPRKSIGPHSKYAEWRLAWHGCKLEGLYSIMYHGKLFASEDGTQGHRFFPDVPGVYVHKDKTGHKACNYIRFVPLCGDGVFWAAMWELYVDRSDRVPVSHPDQWVQEARSVRLAALWLCGRRAADMEQGSEVSTRWEPSWEANPKSVFIEAQGLSEISTKKQKYAWSSP